MAVSLVSTGVQFPDSTIQTTAASGVPNMATNGSTIINLFNTGQLWANGSNAGTIFGTTNINTTAPSVVWQNPELQANMWYNPGASAAFYSQSGYGWNGSGLGISWPRLQYDFYTNRYVITLFAASGSNNSIMNWYSEDGGITWIQFQNSSVASTSQFIPAFNNYTGARVATVNSYGSTIINTYSAANAYNANASATVTYSTNYSATTGPVTFIDTGTQSTSRFFVPANASSVSQQLMLYRAANDDSGTWTQIFLGDRNQCTRVIGSTAEIMCYSSNKGVMRSVDMGDNWSNYNFGSNTFGTNQSWYWTFMAWNGTYWLGTIYNDNDKLVTKAMGSGTSWTTLTNLSGPGITDWRGVAWNPTLGCWIIIKNNGGVYTNTSSDPNSGTWTLVRYLPYLGGQSQNYTPIYVKAAKTFNF